MRRLLQAVAVATVALGFGTTAGGEEQHHTADAANGADTSVPDPAAASASVGAQPTMVLVPGVPTPGGCMMPMMAMMGQGGMGMMGSMMPMMGGGTGMAAQGMTAGAGQPGMAGMAGGRMGPGTGLDRIEGRIAFVRAEIGITDAQAPAWNAFADAVRAAAAHAAQPTMAMAGSAAPATLAQRLESEDAALAARLEDVKALRDALAGLHQVLTGDQSATAEALIEEILGAVVLG